ncbi:hypothetical protein V498_03016 [Pseudogymnoascus sp. VKM F-4517 (FW-2822)]|nr:hypothetical protein V498_03016 [Pseudogymnoascus sp. VKM F-4517 (FW-2822)]
MAAKKKGVVFRVTGLPASQPDDELKEALKAAIDNNLEEDEPSKVTLNAAIVSSCYNNDEKVALVEFQGGVPAFLSELMADPLGDCQVEMGDDTDISFDQHFFGFTQLYTPKPGSPTTAEPRRTRIWLVEGKGRPWAHVAARLPVQGSTMLPHDDLRLQFETHESWHKYYYGLWARVLRSDQEDPAYTRGKLRERPLFFIAHSFGGVILGHCLVKAVQTDERDNATIAALHKATYGILFFGAPHKGLVIDDIQRMVAGKDQHPRMELLEQIKLKSDLLLYQLADFKNLIRDRKIVSFYEGQQTRRLQLNPETNKWGRTGEYVTAVESDSALLELPDSTEAKIPVDADHSQIVKFDNRNAEAYKTAVGYLKEFEQDARKVVLDRFSPTSRKKPPRSTVPFDRDAKFVGRQDALAALELRFCQSKSHNRTVLVGLGGVGKSQIAIEYSYRLRVSDPQVWVFWVYASTAERFEQAYRSIATELELPGADDPKTDVLGLVSRWLSNVDNGRWLLILDNADDIDMFRQVQGEGSKKGNDTAFPLSSYIPQPITGSVLLTTRDRRAASWLSTGYTSVIPVNLMEPEEADQLLRINIPEGLSTSSDRVELIKELDYLPLAITQAAAYISAKATRMSVSKYLMLYRQNEQSQSRLLGKEYGDLRRAPGVRNSVFRTWQISFDQIKQSNPQAAELLSLMAMFDRQGIPEFLLCVKYSNPLDLEEALGPLDEFSLITVETGGNTFEMHRLVQLATRKWLERFGDGERWQREAIEVVAKAFPSGDYNNWKTCEAMSPHATEVLKYKLESDQSMLERASLLYNMAWYNWLQGRYEIAKAESQESLTTRQHLLQDNDTMIFNSIGMLALVLEGQGKYDEAEPMYRQTLLLRETALGKEHPDTLGSMNNLAFLLQSQGKYDEAEPMYRQTLLLREKALGKEHPDTLRSMNNLASLLESQGKYDEAEPMYWQTLLLREKALGKEHPDTLRSMNNLASLLESQGKYDEAEPMYRQTLLLREKALGKEHPNTLSSMNNLASLLKSQGKYNEAEPMYRQTLLLREKALGKEHPDTLGSMNNLASLLKSQGKYDEAEPMYRQTLLLREKALGKEHPNTLRSMNNLASLLESQGKYDEAEPMYRQTLLLREKALGKEHPNTLRSMNNLASLLHSQGSEKTLGKEHPDTLGSMNNLASLLESQGKYDEAEPMYRQTLLLREKALGKEHPNTLRSMNNLAFLLHSQGRYNEAEPIYQQTLLLSEKTLGKEHPDTLGSMNNLASLLEIWGK